MKIINLDDLEQKCIKFGLENNLFKQEDLGKDNKFIINLRGTFQSKTCDILFNKIEPISFYAHSWEDLYYKINEFFRD